MLHSLRHFVAPLALLCAVGLTGCEQKATTAADASAANAQAKVQEYDGLSSANPIRVDPQAGTVTMLATVDGKYLTEGTRHGIVFEHGSNGHKSVFMGYATPKQLYDALLQVKAKPGDNVTFENMETTRVAGDRLDVSFNWAGAARPYGIDEVIKDSNGKKLEMHFGGNLQAAEETQAGCLLCLDSCPVGIISNAAYTYGAVENRKEVSFTGNSAVLPPDGTLVTVTFKVVKS